VTFGLLSFIAIILFVTKETVLKSFTNDEGVLSLTMCIIWLNCLIVIPDSYKGMIRGIIKGLGLQEKCVVINLIGHWGINLSLLFILGFYF
jgi:Na+-driven multidrug efflux pump